MSERGGRWHAAPAEKSFVTVELPPILTRLDLERAMVKVQRVIDLSGSYPHWREMAAEADGALLQIRVLIERGNGL